MRGNELLDKMELIDPAYVTAADEKPKKKNVWIKWAAMAACFCVIVASAVTIPRLRETKPVPVPEAPNVNTPPQVVTEEPRAEHSIHYNEATALADAARKYIPGYFTEELSVDALNGIIPDRQAPDMSFTGTAGFDGEGTLQDVTLHVEAPFLNGAKVTVLFSPDTLPRGYDVGGEPVASKLNGHSFDFYRWSPDGKTMYYDAFGEINGCNMRISYVSDGISEEQSMIDFEVIADCFTDYQEGKPDLSAIKAENIPEFIDLELSISEAQADKDFGAYMLAAGPDGFSLDSIRRYKDQRNDYLTGVWAKGYDELLWQVSYYTEQDAERVTGVDETQNYDIALYPIPRADSVPDELRMIVNDPIFPAEELTLDAVYARAYKSGESGDSSGWRMTFTVKYGDILVRVSSKGVEPEWVYEQLIGLLEKV